MKNLIVELKELVEIEEHSDREFEVSSTFNSIIADVTKKAEELKAELNATEDPFKRGTLTGQRFGMAWVLRKVYEQTGDERLNHLATEIT